MSRRRHHASGRSLPWVLVTILVVVTVGAGTLVVLRRGEDRGPAGTAELPVPEFSFDLTRTRTVAVDKNVRMETLEPVIEEVHDVLDRLYTMGFVDPAEWQDGAFPNLPSVFGQRAGRRVADHLDDLSLGSAASQIARVEPQVGRLRIGVLLDEGEQPASMIAEVRFRARGQAVDGRSLAVRHEGRYILEPLDEGWRIVAYEVEGELDAPPAAAEGAA